MASASHTLGFESSEPESASTSAPKPTELTALKTTVTAKPAESPKLTEAAVKHAVEAQNTTAENLPEPKMPVPEKQAKVLDLMPKLLARIQGKPAKKVRAAHQTQKPGKPVEGEARAAQLRRKAPLKKMVRVKPVKAEVPPALLEVRLPNPIIKTKAPETVAPPSKAAVKQAVLELPTLTPTKVEHKSITLPKAEKKVTSTRTPKKVYKKLTPILQTPKPTVNPTPEEHLVADSPEVDKEIVPVDTPPIESIDFSTLQSDTIPAEPMVSIEPVNEEYTLPAGDETEVFTELVKEHQVNAGSIAIEPVIIAEDYPLQFIEKDPEPTVTISAVNEKLRPVTTEAVSLPPIYAEITAITNELDPETAEVAHAMLTRITENVLVVQELRSTGDPSALEQEMQLAELCEDLFTYLGIEPTPEKVMEFALAIMQVQVGFHEMQTTQDTLDQGTHEYKQDGLDAALARQDFTDHFSRLLGNLTLYLSAA